MNPGWRGPVWTGSCPCQPLSSAGQRKGDADERHLWPAFQQLIAECRPVHVFGEQVSSKLGREWFAAVQADLVNLGYACGAADLSAAGVGAPHIRQRLFWVAESQSRERNLTGNARGRRDGLANDGATERWPSPLANKQSPQQRADFTPNLANVAQLTIPLAASDTNANTLPDATTSADSPQDVAAEAAVNSPTNARTARRMYC